MVRRVVSLFIGSCRFPYLSSPAWCTRLTPLHHHRSFKFSPPNPSIFPGVVSVLPSDSTELAEVSPSKPCRTAYQRGTTLGSQTGVEDITQTISEQVEAEDGPGNGQTREDAEPRLDRKIHNPLS